MANDADAEGSVLDPSFLTLFPGLVEYDLFGPPDYASPQFLNPPQPLPVSPVQQLAQSSQQELVTREEEFDVHQTTFQSCDQCGELLENSDELK